MSRSALAVAGTLFALGVLVWLLASRSDDPGSRADAPVARPPVITAPAETAPPAPAARAEVPAAVAGDPPRITTRDEFAAALKARGLDADKLIARYGDWRVAHGFLEADALAGIGPDEALSSVYETMDRATLKSLADSGDLAAIQAYAKKIRTDDPFAAIDYYRRATEMGSAAAMSDLASILASFGTAHIGQFAHDKPFADRLVALRGGDPTRDLRLDAAAWTLAAIRLYGPTLATPASLDMIEAMGRLPDKAKITAVCGQSLAILGHLSAATASKDTPALPPVFLTEKGLYDRLPCRDTPAPITPPRALDACTPSPATGSDARPVELWICPGS